MPSVFGEMFTSIGLVSATSMTVGERSETTAIQDLAPIVVLSSIQGYPVGHVKIMVVKIW